MYLSYFRLREKPFDIVPNPAYLYLSRTHKKAMTYMRYGLQERLGFVLMTGEVVREKRCWSGTDQNAEPGDHLCAGFQYTGELRGAHCDDQRGLRAGHRGRNKVLMLKDLYAH